MSALTSPTEAVLRFCDLAPTVRVLVAGDCMLDTYVSGEAFRISPEAPVPVVRVASRRYIVGGAANVAANLRGMGAVVLLGGVTGIDDGAIKLRRELERCRINADALIEDAARVTTVKTRITAGGQQIVRFDEEVTSPLAGPVSAELSRRCEAVLDSVDVCIVSDYAKGVIDDAFCRWLIAGAARRGLPIVVDPKSRDLARYRGATVITPNLGEAAAAAGEPIQSPGDLTRAARHLLERITPSALLVTRGGEGMSLFEFGRPDLHLPAMVNEIADVTGAGDTVIGALAIALGIGFTLPEAIGIANIAAGVSVSHHGTWAVDGDELLEASTRLETKQASKAAQTS